LKADERRLSARYPCALETACSPLNGGQQPWQGEALDISLTGIHLQLDRRFEPGSVLRVEVRGEDNQAVANWLVRVRWVREVVSRRWSIGCSFNQSLTDQELESVLEAMSATTVVIEER
jgi:hypothetical protein